MQAVDSDSKSISSDDWLITGKLAIISPEERLSANLFWRHHGSTNLNELRLTGPLGRNVLSLNSNEQSASITVDGETYTGNDVDSLIVRLTGWPLPLSQLSKYLLGKTQPNDDISTDADGQLTSVQLVHPKTGVQSTLNYKGWQELSGYKVPQQIELRQQQTRIKLAIKTMLPE